MLKRTDLRYLGFFALTAAFIALILAAAACSPNNTSTGVVPGYLGTQSCTPGTVNCVNGVYTGGGYVHFVGSIWQNLNAGTARTLISAAGGASCYGSPCWSSSQVDVQSNPAAVAGAPGSYNVTVTFAGSMQALAIPFATSYIVTGSGVDLQGSSSTMLAARIDVLSPQPLDGSVSTVPSVQINVNGQSLATTTLYRVQ